MTFATSPRGDYASMDLSCGQADGSASVVTHLLSLPDELLLDIFQNFTPSELMELESVCKRFRNIFPTAYQSWYGNEFPHRERGTSSWKEMALEQESTMFAGLDPAGAISMLLEEYYLTDDGWVSQVAGGVLKVLRRNIQTTWVFYEAVATAYMVQGRHAEAQDLYKKIFEAQNILPERTWLTEARFGTVQTRLPENPSNKIKRRAFCGAAAAGNLCCIKQLRSMVADLSVLENSSERLGCIAAGAGTLEVARYLHEQGYDMAGDLTGSSNPLWEASKGGHAEIVDFLLHVDANLARTPSVLASLRIAINYGNLEVVRRLIAARPDLTNGRSTDGKLALAAVFEYNFLPMSQTDMLRLLVTDVGIDPCAIGRDGETIAHVAALNGDLDSIKLLKGLGADLRARDKSGQTPFELAINAEHENVATWLGLCSGQTFSLSKQQKMAWASKIIDLLYQDDLPASTKSELANVWTVGYSSNTLQQWAAQFETRIGELQVAYHRIREEASIRQAGYDIDHSYSCLNADAVILDELVPFDMPKSMKDWLRRTCTERMVESDIRALREFYESELGRRIVEVREDFRCEIRMVMSKPARRREMRMLAGVQHPAPDSLTVTDGRLL